MKVENKKADKPKEVNQILQEQIKAGLKEFRRADKSLFISSFGAGLEIGFSIMFMGTLFTLLGEQLNGSQMNIILALCYPVGFIFVIIGRSELFTEHTALAILPVMDGKASIKQLLKLWGIVYSGNLIGGFVFSYIITLVGTKVGFIDLNTFYHLAHKIADYEWHIILFSGIMAGWMMGLLGWLVTSSQETISRIFMIIIITFIIGLAGLHHCIVGSIEVFAGLIVSPKIIVADYLRFQISATVGNAIGGAIFVSVLKYSHGRNF